MIKIIVNADDFGYSKIFNEKIIKLLNDGIIKSTTVMVEFIGNDQIDQINELMNIKNKYNISIGLHCVFDLNSPLQEQFNRQYEKFIKIFNFKPSHLDIHKHTKDQGCIDFINMIGKSKDLPIRYNKSNNPPSTIHTTYPVISNVPFDLITTISMIETIKDGESIEILCHPGEFDKNCKSSFNEQRKIDYEGVIKLNSYINQNKSLILISYNEL